ncbi:MAG: hypothetical protein ACNI26_15060 [Terasakiella sp.]|uniref:hypothetical protein n=1 Tax=unclassified Terasakiella TaxID=2614952 RepID=UPI003AFFA2FE
MSNAIKPYGNTCTVELDLPWEVAELLVEQGPVLIKEITLALKMRKQRTDCNAKFAALAEQDRKEAKERFHNLGRIVDEALTGQTTAEQRVRLSILADEHDTNPSFLKLVRKLYRERIVTAERELRDAQIIRFYFQGLSNKEIGRRVGTSVGNVSTILSRQGNLITALRRLIREAERAERTRGGAK